ncbi:MAG: hypothetical protein IPN85_13635 [Flavobacteriales bacterium]|nr:hypothetical protein [Flavobacteriales bacterium]MBK9289074.1 hypothetical protein [Flavobacteriales bacterium]MBL0035893.1 hypothetical protein [Flavobacteriales bacterium]
MHTLRTLTFLAITATLITSCKKDDDVVEDTHVHHHGTIKVAYNFVNEAQPFTLDSTVADSLGHKVRFTSVRFFTSGYAIEDDAENTVADFPANYILVDAALASNEHELGEMEEGHAHALALNLGLDSATNHSDPTQYTTAPLNDATMHWSWNPAMGYKFLVLEGRVDANGDGLVDGSDPEFVYHCASDDLLTETEVEAHHDLVEGETFTVAVKVNMATMLAGIDVASNLNAMGATPVNARAMQNLAASLSTE